MSRFLMLSCCALLASGCYSNSNSENQTTQSTAVLKKPVVTVVPLIDHSESEIAWNLSEELTISVCSRLSQTDKYHLLEPQKVFALTKKLNDTQNPFGNDLSWVKKAFSQDDYVVFMELIRHDEIPLTSNKTPSAADAPADLNMSLRLRVIDLRGEQPQIVLQELVHETHRIARPFNRYNFTQVSWGENDYSISPIGMAHAQLSNIVAHRIGDYIQANLQR